MDLSRFSIDTVTLSGSLEDKLRVIRDAGFGGIEIWAKDLVTHPGGVPGAVAAIRASGLRVSSFQLLKDYEGLDAHLHEYKIDIAKSLLDLMDAVEAKLLVVASSTSTYASGDMDKIVADLRALATLATPRAVRVAFGAPAWAKWINEYPMVWEAVRRADCVNLGVLINAFHLLARSTSLDKVDDIPGERIFLVQLADYLGDLKDITETADHRRAFPNESAHRDLIGALVRKIHRAGYRGDYVFEVFNDEYLHLAPESIVGRARKAAQWLIDETASALP
ncbi:MAG TPA: sugar phosphate isomerase/epimerase [Casimicrobiaceae bacterium]|jgi:sugar phosphate isomerase/epimerase